MRPVYCGIDFGTSNSTVAIACGEERRLVALEDGKTTLPSALFFRPDAAPLFGRRAIESYTGGDEGRFMRGLKKILGTSLMNETTKIGNRSVPFTEILKNFVAHLKEKAEAESGNIIDHVIMGRPVHFHDGDETADKAAQETLQQIASAAGFKHIDFLYEPIAAAFAHEADFNEEKLSLVVDLGGGTSDFTIIKTGRHKTNKADRRDDILATSGVRIGGTTFDYRLSLKTFMPELGLGTQYHDLFDKKKLLHVPTGVYFQLADWALVNFAQTKKAILETQDIKKRSLAPKKIARLLKLQENHLGHALLGEVEHAKIMLTDDLQYTATLKDLDDDIAFNITRADFESSIEDDVIRIMNSIAECLAQAGIAPDAIDLVILTGGSTELPLVNTLIRETFPRAAISQGNKLDSVGLGLAYRAANIF